MAFPTVQTADTKNGTVTSNSTSWTITYCTNIAPGNLLLLFLASDGVGAQTTTGLPSGWNVICAINNASAVSGLIASKIADGSETGTFTFTAAASEQGAWRMYRITGWYGSGDFTTEDLGIPGASQRNFAGLATISNNSSAGSPNGAILDPTTWTGAEDTLWIDACMVDTSRTVTTFPSNMPDLNTSDVSGGAGGATLGNVMLNSAVESINPNTWTMSSGDDWVNFVTAVRPAAAAAPGPVHKKKRLDRFLTMR